VGWWVRDHQRRGQVADKANWDLATCKEEAIDCMDVEAARAEDKSKVNPPSKLKDGDWVQWELELINFLQNMLGVSGIPFHHVVRKDLPLGHQIANPAESLIHECTFLNGLVHAEGNRKVFSIVEQAMEQLHCTKESIFPFCLMQQVVTRYIYLGLSKWSECSVCVTMSPLLYGSLSRIRLTVVHDT
jgi:hypothetical protein